MDVELLIAAVQEREPLWNKWNKNHSNRNVVHKLWAEVSKELNCEEALVRRKWKYLRDQFAVEFGKAPAAPSSDAGGDTPTSKWRYFKLLQFLKDVVKPRASNGNLSSMPDSDTADMLYPESPQDHKTITVEFPLATDEGKAASSSHTRDTPERDEAVKRRLTSPSTQPMKEGACKRLKADDNDKNILDIERKIQQLIEMANPKPGQDDGEDMMFFKSLLPHVKRIPDTQKLTFRSRLQELVQQFAYQVPATPLPDTHDSSSSAAAKASVTRGS